MIEYVSILIAILSGFAAVIGFLYQILQEVRKNLDKINENAANIVELRTNVEKEFARCRMHQCGGMRQEMTQGITEK